MRKHYEPLAETTDLTWIDLEKEARVELTSEDPDFPIEAALIPEGGDGWRAAKPGRQLIRLRFDTPQTVSHIRVRFHVDDYPRTQEFVLRWSSDRGVSYREVVRQQYNFSPPSVVREEEDYHVELSNLTELELMIIPDLAGGAALASLQELRLS